MNPFSILSILINRANYMPGFKKQACESYML